MARKLEETNADIKAAASMIAADEAFDRTLFIVMGDHGMTTDGDHGGSTQDETDTFIFVHRPRAAKLNQSQTLRNTSSRLHLPSLLSLTCRSRSATSVQCNKEFMK
jgi:phosphatidylinositol glycan class O